MATVFIQKRARKNRNSYVVYFKDPVTLRLRYFKTFQKRKEADQAAYELRSLIDNGKLPEIGRRKARLRLMTFGEVSHDLKRKWQKRLERGSLRPRTYEDYVYTLNSLARRFGKSLLIEISRDAIVAHRQELFSAFSAVTANRNLFIIKQVFKHGLEKRAIFEDPSAQVRYLNEDEHMRNSFIMPEVLENLVQASRKTRAKFYMPALILLGAEHGASKQEALSLKWKDIDFNYNDQGIIRFFREKNKRERTEYLMPRTKEALLAWRDHLNFKRKKSVMGEPESDFVFCRLDGTPIKRFDSAWRRAREIAGLDDFHFHDLRHTFCSNLLLSGAGLKDVKEMIGHSDLSMTDRYAHLTLDHKRHRQNRLAEHYVNGRQSGLHIGYTKP
jgi:integrase